MSQRGPTFNCDRLSAPKGRLTSHLVVENRRSLTAGEKEDALIAFYHLPFKSIWSHKGNL